MCMCGHSDKRLDIESEYIQYVRYESSFKISHICTKRREVFHRPQKNRIIIYIQNIVEKIRIGKHVVHLAYINLRAQ